MAEQTRAQIEAAAKGDGADPDGCAACGGTLLIKAAPEDRKAWLVCAGCQREFPLGPIFTEAVRSATGIADLTIDPLTPPTTKEDR